MNKIKINKIMMGSKIYKMISINRDKMKINKVRKKNYIKVKKMQDYMDNNQTMSKWSLMKIKKIHKNKDNFNLHLKRRNKFIIRK